MILIFIFNIISIGIIIITIIVISITLAVFFHFISKVQILTIETVMSHLDEIFYWIS